MEQTAKEGALRALTFKDCASEVDLLMKISKADRTQDREVCGDPERDSFKEEKMIGCTRK